MTFENYRGGCLAGTRSCRPPWIALCALGLAYAVSGCADSDENDCDGIDTSAAALHGGTTSFAGSRDASVVALLSEFDDDRDARLCSGVYVARGVVLTAEHCAMEGARTTISFGDSVSGAVSQVEVHHFVADFDGDLALAVFDPNTNPNTKPIPPLADPDIAVGDSVTLAGFGEDEKGSVGSLRFAQEPVAELDDQTITVDGSGKSGACVGDSGGPLLWIDAGGELRVIGVLSVGSPSCTDIDVYQRIDPKLSDEVQSIEQNPDVGRPFGPEGPSRPYEGC
jgi:hypothetical protein